MKLRFPRKHLEKIVNRVEATASSKVDSESNEKDPDFVEIDDVLFINDPNDFSFEQHNELSGMADIKRIKKLAPESHSKSTTISIDAIDSTTKYSITSSNAETSPTDHEKIATKLLSTQQTTESSLGTTQKSEIESTKQISLKTSSQNPTETTMNIDNDLNLYNLSLGSAQETTIPTTTSIAIELVETLQDDSILTIGTSAVEIQQNEDERESTKDEHDAMSTIVNENRFIVTHQADPVFGLSLIDTQEADPVVGMPLMDTQQADVGTPIAVFKNDQNEIKSEAAKTFDSERNVEITSSLVEKIFPQTTDSIITTTQEVRAEQPPTTVSSVDTPISEVKSSTYELGITPETIDENNNEAESTNYAQKTSINAWEQNEMVGSVEVDLQTETDEPLQVNKNEEQSTNENETPETEKQSTISEQKSDDEENLSATTEAFSSSTATVKSESISSPMLGSSISNRQDQLATSKVPSKNQLHPLLNRILLGSVGTAQPNPIQQFFDQMRNRNSLTMPLFKFPAFQQKQVQRRKKNVKRGIDESNFVTPKQFEPFSAPTVRPKLSLLEHYHSLDSAEKAEKVSKFLEKLLHGVQILGHVDGYLTGRAKSSCKKLHKLFATSEEV